MTLMGHEKRQNSRSILALLTPPQAHRHLSCWGVASCGSNALAVAGAGEEAAAGAAAAAASAGITIEYAKLYVA